MSAREEHQPRLEGKLPAHRVVSRIIYSTVLLLTLLPIHQASSTYLLIRSLMRSWKPDVVHAIGRPLVLTSSYRNA